MKKEYDGLKVFKISLSDINTTGGSNCHQMVQLNDPGLVNECTECGQILKMIEVIGENF